MARVKTLVEVDQLRFGYPQETVFAGFSGRFRAGITVLIGDEGCGKTTLLRLLAGELPLQSGEITLRGVSLRRDADLYRRMVYWADPTSNAFDQISALDFFARLRNHHQEFPAPDDPSLAQLVDGLSMGAHLHKPLYMLSTGSKRKVWLIGALASRAVLTLLDDPLAALDKSSIHFLLDAFAAAARDSERALIVAQYERLPAAVTPVQRIDLPVRR